MAREVLVNAASPVVGAPAQLAMGIASGPPTNAVATAYNILSQHQSLRISQLRQWVEALTGFERNNRYMVRDENGRDLFFIRENSSCIERNCCHGACKAWRMDVYLLGPDYPAGGEGSMTPFMHLERQCTCTCMCLNRPEVVISEIPSGRILGSVREPFTFCNLRFVVHNPDESPVLETDTSCCQWGLCCACPCEGLACNQVSFPLTDVNSGTEIAEIVKQWMWGDCIQCLGEWDNYRIRFGDGSNSDYKVLLLAVSIFIQVRLFDRRNQQNN